MEFLNLGEGMKKVIEDINRKISKVKDNLIRRESLENMLKQCRKKLEQEEIRRIELSNILNKKEKQIQRLEASSSMRFFHSIFKRKHQNLDKERQEYAVIKSKYEVCRSSINQLQSEIDLYKEEISNYYLLDIEYDNLMNEKKNLMLNKNDDVAYKLRDISKKISDLEPNIRELKVAISVGSSAQAALEKVIDSLESAKDWGVWDVMGGGMLVTAAKHSKLDKAKEQTHYAQKMIKAFNSQLSYTNLQLDISIEIGSFATFADYFFDGIISDWFVQGKIRDSLSKTKDAYNRIKRIVNALQSRVGDLSRELDSLKEEMSTLID